MTLRTIAVGILLAVAIAGGAYAIGIGPGSSGLLAEEATPKEPAVQTPTPPAPNAAGPDDGTTASGGGAAESSALSPTGTPSPTPTATPTPKDPDADNLPTGYEESIGTDPMHKTVLLAVEYTGNASNLSAGDRSFLRTKFDQLKVTNPDGTTGVTLRIVEEWRTGDNVTVNSTTLRRRAISSLSNETPAQPCRHHYLVVGAPEGSRWGIAVTGGWTAIVKSERTGFSGSREDVIVHELLHNLVGELDPERSGVRPDGAHTQSGWLQPKAEMSGPSSLHAASREALNERGFANRFSDQPGCL
jgi:hypothetical protein